MTSPRPPGLRAAFRLCIRQVRPQSPSRPPVHRWAHAIRGLLHLVLPHRKHRQSASAESDPESREAGGSDWGRRFPWHSWGAPHVDRSAGGRSDDPRGTGPVVLGVPPAGPQAKAGFGDRGTLHPHILQGSDGCLEPSGNLRSLVPGFSSGDRLHVLGLAEVHSLEGREGSTRVSRGRCAPWSSSPGGHRAPRPPRRPQCLVPGKGASIIGQTGAV